MCYNHCDTIDTICVLDVTETVRRVFYYFHFEPSMCIMYLLYNTTHTATMQSKLQLSICKFLLFYINKDTTSNCNIQVRTLKN